MAESSRGYINCKGAECECKQPPAATDGSNAHLLDDSAVDPLVIAYQSAKDTEEGRWLKEHPPYHSPWNPQLTYSMDKTRVERLCVHLKQWSVGWMQERGYRVIFADDDSDNFNVEPF